MQEMGNGEDPDEQQFEEIRDDNAIMPETPMPLSHSRYRVIETPDGGT